MGELIASLSAGYLNRTGALIVLLTLLFMSVILATQFSFGRMFAFAFQALRRDGGTCVASLREWRENRRRDKQRQRGDREAREEERREAARSSRPSVLRVTSQAARAKPPVPSRRPSRSGWPPRHRAVGARRASVTPPLPLTETDGAASRAPIERKLGASRCRRSRCSMRRETERKIDERELMEAARQLEEKCREFAVEGTVVQIHPGPVVTTYEFKPDAGVKYSKITGLADDLCLAMQAESVLIDRHPRQVHGRHPDSQRAPRDDLAARAARIRAVRRSASKLSLALGKTIHGEPFVARSGDDAAPAHRGLDRHGQVGRAERR